MAPSEMINGSAIPVPPEVYNWRIYMLAICASMGSAMFGYDSSFIGGTLVLPSFQRRFGLKELSGTSLASLKANTVSTFQAGCFFGAIICYFLTERWGRKLTLVACGVIFNIGVILQLASSGMIGLIYAGRAVTGLGVGASSLLVPVYISECSPPAIRGRLIGIFEVLLQGFQVIGFWVNYAVNIHQSPNGDAQWLIPFAFQLVPGTALAVAMLTQPESPRWLIAAGKESEALKVLCRIRNLPVTDQYLNWEIQTISAQLEVEMQNRSGKTVGLKGILRELKVPRNLHRLLLGMAIMLLQNLVGANAINYYSPAIFTSVGLKGTSVSLLATGLYGIVKVIATFIFIGFIVDRVGRRRPLLIGSVGAFTCMLYLGIYTCVSGAFDGTAKQNGAAYLAIVMVYLFAICFCWSWNSVAWIFCAEIFPLAIRSACLVVTTCFQWLGQFIVVYSTPFMMVDLKWGTFIFFAAFVFVGFFFAYFLVPETSGLTLEEMDILFSQSGSARQKRRKLDAMGITLEQNLDELSEKPASANGKHIEAI